ncbi:MAG TPA: hypothetical protein VI485_11770 [Vicinamibacterales bacterium]|nr:hypothetical protein [Vicinamibacterales bacterium]
MASSPSICRKHSKLKANATALSETSQKALATILDPLRERIQDFQKKVEKIRAALRGLLLPAAERRD